MVLRAGMGSGREKGREKGQPFRGKGLTVRSRVANWPPLHASLGLLEEPAGAHKAAKRELRLSDDLKFMKTVSLPGRSATLLPCRLQDESNGQESVRVEGLRHPGTYGNAGGKEPGGKTASAPARSLSAASRKRATNSA